MSYENFKKLLKCANKIGITTAGELDAYKRGKGITSNFELYVALLVEANETP